MQIKCEHKQTLRQNCNFYSVTRNVSHSKIISTKNYDLKNGSGNCGTCYAVCSVTTLINLTYHHRQRQQNKTIIIIIIIIIITYYTPSLFPL